MCLHQHPVDRPHPGRRVPGNLTVVLDPHPTGLVSVPEYPFLEQKEDFTFASLLTRHEVITALGKVRAECNKVTAMSLFHSSLSKYSRLEEFEQIQSQTISQVRGQQKHRGRPPETCSRQAQTGQGPRLHPKTRPALPRPCGRWGGA
ncbi:hypothetical protein MC885_021333 [Smutsia gigantea]|nr:hypothetical protein MC885_021333 [Smutsia gigantea]